MDKRQNPAKFIWQEGDVEVIIPGEDVEEPGENLKRMIDNAAKTIDTKKGPARNKGKSRKLRHGRL